MIGRIGASGSRRSNRGGDYYAATVSVQLPPTLVERLIVHELVHLDEPNHTPEFWQRVEPAMPDYEQRKAWLAEHGWAAFVLSRTARASHGRTGFLGRRVANR